MFSYNNSLAIATKQNNYINLMHLPCCYLTSYRKYNTIQKVAHFSKLYPNKKFKGSTQNGTSVIPMSEVCTAYTVQAMGTVLIHTKINKISYLVKKRICGDTHIHRPSQYIP